MPSPEEVTTYLAAHSLESAIETAVNDAVLKQVKIRCGMWLRSCSKSRRLQSAPSQA